MYNQIIDSNNVGRLHSDVIANPPWSGSIEHYTAGGNIILDISDNNKFHLNDANLFSFNQTVTGAWTFVNALFSGDLNNFAGQANIFDLNIGNKVTSNGTSYPFSDLNKNVITECSGDTNSVLNNVGDCINLSGMSSGGGGDDVNSFGKLVGLTSSAITPDLNYGGFAGYKAANYLCDDNFSGSYLCTIEEIILTVRTEDLTSYEGETAWAAEGAPGYTSNSNDCAGYTTKDTSPLGSFYNFTSMAFNGGKGSLTACSGSKKLACCK
jgi:hypothetical protein